MSESGLTYLSNNNPHDRDYRIKFKDDGHVYYLDDSECKKTDGWLSCTTLVHSQFPKFNPDLIIKRMMTSKNWPNNKYYPKSANEIKKLWDDSGLASRLLGTKMHLMIEQIYNNDNINNIDKNDIEKEAEVFDKFYNDHKHLEPFRTEMLVFDEDVKITGSIDMIFKNEDGTISIYDWKRSKSIEMTTKYRSYSTTPFLKHLPDANGVHYSLQLNIYKKILEKNYGYKVKELFLVRIYPDNDSYEKIECIDLQEDVSKIFENRIKKFVNIKDNTIGDEDNTITDEDNVFSKCMI